jgi:hypothetical protein
MVSQNPRKHFSLATSFLDFWTSNISGLRQKKKTPDSGTFFVRNTYLKYIYIL